MVTVNTIIQGDVIDHYTHLGIDSVMIDFVINDDTTTFWTDLSGHYGGTITEIKNYEVNLPDEFILEQNAPNPTNGATVIKLSHDWDRLIGHTVEGREFFDQDLKGQNYLSIDKVLATGVYFYTAIDNETGRRMTKKMVFLDGGNYHITVQRYEEVYIAPHQKLEVLHKTTDDVLAQIHLQKNGYFDKDSAATLITGMVNTLDFSMIPLTHQFAYTQQGRITKAGTTTGVENARVLSIFGADTLLDELTDTNGDYMGSFFREEQNLPNITFKVSKENYQALEELIALAPGVNIKNAELTPIPVHVLNGTLHDIYGETPLNGTLYAQVDDTTYAIPVVNGEFDQEFIGHQGTSQAKLWFVGNGDYSNGTWSILRGDSVAVRGIIAQGYDSTVLAWNTSTNQYDYGPDTAKASLGELAITAGVKALAIPDSLMNSWIFTNGVGRIFKRYDDYTTEICRNQFDLNTAQVGGPIAQSLLDDFLFLVNKRIDYNSLPNSLQLINMDYVIVDDIVANNNRAYLFQDSTAGPGNTRGPPNAQGYLWYTFAFVPGNGLITYPSAEYNEGVLREPDGNTLGLLLNLDGTLNRKGLAAYITVHVFRNTTTFNPP